MNMNKFVFGAFAVGYLLGGLNLYLWQVSHRVLGHSEDLISHETKMVEGYTLWKLCPDGKTAMEEISNDGTKIITLDCVDKSKLAL
jgi:hypothetical protein